MPIRPYRLNRRQATIALLATAVANAKPGAARDYNFADPTDAVEAFTRIRGDSGGALSYIYTRGRVYLAMPDQAHRAFLGYEAMVMDQYQRAPAGAFLQTRREVQHFLDLDTGELANNVSNPITGQVDQPMHGIVGPLQFAVTPRGIAYNTHDPAQAPGTPMALLWEQRGRDTVVSMETLRRYRNTMQPADWPSATTGEFRIYADFLSFTVSSAQLTNRKLTGLPAQVFYSGQTALQPWMFMGQQPGHMLWHASGFKTLSKSDLPASFVAITERLHPGLLANPMGYREETGSYEEKIRARLRARKA